MLKYSIFPFRILLLYTALAFVFFPINPLSASEQVICNGTVTNLNTTTTQYGTIMGMPTDTWSTTESNHGGIVPVAGRFKKMIVETENDPSVGSWTFTFRVNEADTSLSCSIASGNTSCTSSDSVNVAAGDSVTFEVAPSGGPVASDAYWSVLFEPAVRSYSILMGGTSSAMNTAAIEYYPLHGYKAGDVTLTDVETLIPLEGTVRDLYVDLQGVAPGAGKSYTFTVLKNGAASAVTCTVTGAATSTCSDTSNTFTVTAGDAIALEKSAAGTPTAATASYGLVIETDTEGEFVVAVSSDDTLINTGALEYMYGSAGDGNWGTTEAARNQICLATEFRAMYVELSQSPGGTSGNWIFALRSDTVTQGLNCSVIEPATTCNKTSTVTYADGAGINYVNRETSDAANAPKANISLRGFIQPRPKLGSVLLVN